MPKSGMTRRDALALTAAGTLASACGGPTANGKTHVAVIGGGIIGAAIAYYLTQGGAQVTVLERNGLASRASHGTFAWLNASWAKQPRHYHRLNQLGLAGWKELVAEAGLPIKWAGSIEWFGSEERQQKLARQIDEQVEWGEPARMIARDELQSMEPGVAFGDLTSAAFSPNDGALDPVLATQTLMDRAIALGAKVETNCEAISQSRTANGTTILTTTNGELECDTIVLATGADPNATRKLAGIDIPQRTTPGVIAITKPMAPMIDAIIVAPGVHIHQRGDGRVVLGEQGGAPQNEAHAARLADRPTSFPNADFAGQHARRILDVAVRYVPALSTAEMEEVIIGWRPLPLDGHPVIGFSPEQPGAYLAITHSGVSLAPIVGKMTAQEILNGHTVAALDAYRPDRDFETIQRY
ncbi:MAG: FAD-dependent oxidoreductase [Erythrobacter sp.]